MGIFSSGIRQNVMFLHDTLFQIGYDAHLIVCNLKDKDVTQLYGVDSTYKFTDHSQILSEEFDLIIQMGYNLAKNDVTLIRNKGIKLVAYNCGNDYIFDLEATLFGTDGLPDQYNHEYPPFDEVWTLPHHMNTNAHYLSSLFRTKCVEVPYIWSPSLMEHYEKECLKTNIGTLSYKKREGAKSCAIFEPNRNVVKWCFPAVLVCENTCRVIPELVKHVYVTNIDQSSKRFNLDYFNRLVKSLDLFKTKKLSIELRFNSILFMSKHADIAVSHQWENSLNNLYFDLAWMGWPLVHNAHLCKDVGYYYEGFNYEMGGAVLARAIQNHDEDSEAYMARNRAVIGRYLPTNRDVQAKYRELIENVLPH